MDSSTKAVVTAAMAGGYLLGRTRKAKMVFAVGTFIAGRRFGLTPTALAAEGLRQLKENPRFAELRGQISGELLTAARSAASASADRHFSSLAAVLRDRSRDDQGEPEGAEGEAVGDEEDGEAEAPRRRPAAEKGAPAKKKAAEATPARKATPARRAGKKAAPARSAANRGGR